MWTSITSTIRSAYAWVLLSVLILPLFPVARVVAPLMDRRDRRRDRCRVFVSSWASSYGRLSPLYRFRIEGRDRLPEGEPYVIIANHESGLDTMAMLMLRTPARFLAESWLFRVPLAGSLFRACRHIPVRVGDRESGRAALEKAAEALDEGTPVAVFPEGQLAPDGMEAFRPGAFVAAHRAAVPIIPVLLEGTGSAWRPGTMVVHGRHEIRIAVLAPIPAEVCASTDPGVLAELARKQIDQARGSRGLSDAAPRS
jgi:1-acyl-sn-glycerol-3-phosphate acyltransferase